MKKVMEIITTVFLGLTIVVLFLSCVGVYYDFLSLKTYSYILYGVLGFSLPLIILNKVKLKDIYLILIMILFLLISTFLSDSIKDCIFGFMGRYEGLLSLLTYFSLFVLASKISNQKYRKIIVNIILIMGVLNVLMALLQTFRIVEYNNLYPKSFLGNSGSYSALCLMYCAISIGLFMFSDKKVYMFYLPIFIYGLIIGGSVGCYVGLASLIIFIIVYLIVNRKRFNMKSIFKRLTLLFVVGIVSLFLIENFTNKHIMNDIKSIITDAKEILNGNIRNDQGNNRIEIWTKVASVVPEYLVHGVGIDRLYYALDDGNYLTSFYQSVDKAHNEYLQILVTEGIFMLITYIFFLIWVIINALRNSKNSYIILSLLFAIIAYLIQALFGISVTRVTPILYIIMGLCMNDFNNQKEKEIKNVAQ